MSEATNPPTAAAIDPRYQEFLDRFNRSEYWDSHESLEGPWRESGSVFFHGLILYASAFVHVQRGNRHGIAAQLGKAQPRLAEHRPHYLGLDVDRILEHAAECRQIVAENPEVPEEAWEVLVPRPRLVFRPELVRGNEPELTGSRSAPATESRPHNGAAGGNQSP